MLYEVITVAIHAERHQGEGRPVAPVAGGDIVAQQPVKDDFVQQAADTIPLLVDVDRGNVIAVEGVAEGADGTHDDQFFLVFGSRREIVRSYNFV